jgi:hypothetical protein
MEVGRHLSGEYLLSICCTTIPAQFSLTLLITGLDLLQRFATLGFSHHNLIQSSSQSFIGLSLHQSPVKAQSEHAIMKCLSIILLASSALAAPLGV